MRPTVGATLAALTVIFAVSAHATHTCTVGVGNLNFGMYLGNQTTSSTTMTVSCTITNNGSDQIAFTATLSTGNGSYPQRYMKNIGSPSDTLDYNLYLGTVPAILNTNVWGDGSTGTVTASGLLKVQWVVKPTDTATFTVAGAIPSVATMPPPGPYQDNIVGTVTYN